MSRIGKKPIPIPGGVTVTVKDQALTVQGPKGTLTRRLSPYVTVVVEGQEVRVDVRNKEDNAERAVWGTTGAHIANMVNGVVQGFKKQLEVNGVGYRAAMQGKDVKLEVGFSHPVVFTVPDGITVAVEKNVLTVSGIDKELVGEVAAQIRNIRQPEPYKGKGIKYLEETIRRKAGKAAKTASA